MNALVFGLIGAVGGGLIGLLTGPDGEIPKSKPPIAKIGETANSGNLIQVDPSTELPPFLKERIKPLLIESYVERDSVGEDGSLHEPHRVYRIRQSPELIPQPLAPTKKPEEKK